MHIVDKLCVVVYQNNHQDEENTYLMMILCYNKHMSRVESSSTNINFWVSNVNTKDLMKLHGTNYRCRIDFHERQIVGFVIFMI